MSCTFVAKMMFRTETSSNFYDHENDDDDDDDDDDDVCDILLKTFLPHDIPSSLSTRYFKSSSVVEIILHLMSALFQETHFKAFIQLLNLTALPIKICYQVTITFALMRGVYS